MPATSAGMTTERRRNAMRSTTLAGCAVTLAIMVAGAMPQRTHAQANDPPNAYRTVESWAKLPDGRKWGQTISVAVDRDGNIWATDGRGKEGKGHQVFKFSPD